MIYWVPGGDENHSAKKHLDYNRIEYTIWDEWVFENGKSVFVLPKNKFILITSYCIFKHADIERLVHDISVSDGTIYFCSQTDNMVEYLKFKKYLVNLKNVYFHMDAPFDDLKEQRIVTTDFFTYSHVLNQFVVYTNIDRNRDFLLTSFIGIKTERQKLVDSLEHKKLLKNYIGNISKEKNYDKWLGITCNPEGFREDVAISWDLYASANYELVPETCYDHGSFYTEKTIKPMVARIPFIVLSNKGFYESLHKTGFETFGNLIDESFSSEPDLDKRINGITNTMLELDPREFYRGSREICEHNYNNLCIQHYRSKQRFQDQLHEFLSQKG